MLGDIEVMRDCFRFNFSEVLGIEVIEGGKV